MAYKVKYPENFFILRGNHVSVTRTGLGQLECLVSVRPDRASYYKSPLPLSKQPLTIAGMLVHQSHLWSV